MGAALRIIVDVLVFRLRRLEMANLVAAVSIMLALRLPWADVAVRAGFGVVLNVLAYLTNDYFDVHRDLAAGRELEKTRYLREHLKEAAGAQIGLALVLLGIAAVWDWELVVAGVLGAGICLVYSARLKMMPVLDVAAMIAWGVAMPLVAIPLGHSLGWLLVIQLGLFSAVFESIQVLRDHDEDQEAGIVTTAVKLGVTRGLWLARGFMFVCATYAVCLLHQWAGLFMLVAVLLPFGRGDESKYWTRVRIVLGLGWLAILATVYFTGKPMGLLVLP